MQEKKDAVFISQRRRIRIKRIKKFIKWLVLLGIMIPSILSVILFFKVSSLNKSVYNLEEKWNLVLEKNKQEFIIESSELEEQEQIDQVKLSDLESNESLPFEIVKQGNQVEDILPNSTRKIYLTFDDGPSLNTSEILDILKEYDVKATFFVVGKDDEYSRQMYKRIVEEGHTLGLHSYSHEYDEIYSSAEAFLDDFWKESNFVYEVTGIRPFCYRFPGGSSTTKMVEDVEIYKQCLEACNVKYFDWNVSSQDASIDILTKEQIIENVTVNLSNYETKIILFHDAYGKQSTVDAIPEIIEYILNMENTVLLPISKGTEQIHQK